MRPAVRMRVRFLVQKVRMRMRMLEGMRVRRAVVRVYDGVRVGVCVAETKRVERCERRADRHDEERGNIEMRQRLFQQQEGEQRAEKRIHRIIRARASRAEIALRPYIEEYAEAVREKAEKERRADRAGSRKAFPERECRCAGAEAGKMPFRMTIS